MQKAVRLNTGDIVTMAEPRIASVCFICLFVGVEDVEDSLTCQNQFETLYFFGKAVMSELGDVLVHIIHSGSLIGEASGTFKIKLAVPVAMLEEGKDFILGHVSVKFGWGGGGRVGHERKLAKIHKITRKTFDCFFRQLQFFS